MHGEQDAVGPTDTVSGRHALIHGPANQDKRSASQTLFAVARCVVPSEKSKTETYCQGNIAA